jgi:CubicO group peptidase (beta-lactamase class C family)
VNLIRCSIALLSLLVLVSTTQTAAETPEVIEERRAMGFLEAVRAGDSEALLQYMRENWIPAEEGGDRDERWTRVAESLTERHAGLEIVGVFADEPHRLTVKTEEEDGPALQFIFEFEADPPYRLSSIGLEAGAGARGPKLAPLEVSEGAGMEEIGKALDRWFRRLADNGEFSGAALVAWKGEAIFQGAWGLASREWRVQNSIDTRFDLGSINKSFTQIAVAQLIDQGKLSFDDRIGDHLPDYPNAEVAKKVTIRHLLEHTAGLGDIFTAEYSRTSKALYRSPRDFFPLFADKPLRVEPGEQKAYSNAGYMVLGAIIEAASGEPYDEYILDHIFKPARMTMSGFFAKDEPESNVAVGYTRMGPEGETDELRNNLFRLPIKGNSAGSAHSTVQDLLKFDNALREHRLLPPAYTSLKRLSPVFPAERPE